MNYEEARSALSGDKVSIYKIYGLPIIEIMSSYNMNFEDATKLKAYSKEREEQLYWENMAAAGKAHQERKSKKPTLFGSILNIVGFVIFVLCCFGGLIGVIIGLIISGIIYSIVENNYSTITQPSPHTLEIVDHVKEAKVAKAALDIQTENERVRQHNEYQNEYSKLVEQGVRPPLRKKINEH